MVLEKKSVSERFKTWFFGVSPEEKASLILKRYLDIGGNGVKSPNLPAEMASYGSVVDVPYNYFTLVKLARGNEVLRTDIESIIREAVRNGSDVLEKYVAKCKVCGAEYHIDVEKCTAPDCGSTSFIYPDTSQKETAKIFLDKPNRDNSTNDIDESILRFMLSTDDFWVSIQKNGVKPTSIRVEDSRYMRLVWDKEKGTLGNGEYFCPICTVSEPEKSYMAGERCRKHPEVELKETHAIYAEGQRVMARFARDEVYHGMMHPWLPDFYGVSLIISGLRIIYSTIAMDDFNYNNYSTGKLAQILAFEGLTPEEAEDLAQAVKARVDKSVSEGKSMRTLYLGGKGRVDSINSMPDSSAMQSLEWWKLWREVMSSLYGVTPIFSGVVESGKTGNNPRMQVDVNNNMTEYVQKKLDEVYNAFIFPAIGVTDYIRRSRPVEEKDEAQDIAILTSKVDLMIKAVNAGMNAHLDEEGRVNVSGTPEKQELGGFNSFNKDSYEKSPFDDGKVFKKENVINEEKGVKQ